MMNQIEGIDPSQLQTRWIQYIEKNAMNYHLLASWAVIVIYPIWIIFDYLFAYENWMFFGIIRISGSICLLFSLLIWKKYRYGSLFQGYLFTLILYLSVAYMIPLMSTNKYMWIYFLGYSTCFIASSIMQFWNIIHGIITLTIALIFNVFLYSTLKTITVRDVLENGGLLTISVAAASFTLLWSRMSFAKKNFLLEETLDETNKQLHQESLNLQEALKNLKTAQKKIIAMEKLDTLKVMIDAFAHEIKNPLNIVLNVLEICKETSHDLEDELKKYKDQIDFDSDSFRELDAMLSKADQYSHRVNSIVDKMMDHMGNSNEPLENLNFGELIRESVDEINQIMDNTITKNIEVEYQFDDFDNVMLYKGDMTKTIQAIYSNSIYALNKKLEGEDYSPKITFKLFKNQSEISLEITDNGTGIKIDALEKIFNPFFTDKKAGSAPGLGLSVAENAVKKHGGTITADSEEGSFTKISIILLIDH